MGYSIELKNIRIKDYKEILRNQNLLPGRRILQDNIDENFQTICNFGINNLDELYKVLNKPQKLDSLAIQTGLSKEFLTILKREVGSFIQKPVWTADFPGLLPGIEKKLNENGIKTSKDLYDFSKGFSDIKLVCDKIGITESDAKELFSLCDLVRINGVGAVFARILYIAGLNKIEDLATADAGYILQKVYEINKDNQYTKAKLGQKDMQFCIDFAKIISRRAL
jgi:hypothetical protein